MKAGYVIRDQERPHFVTCTVVDWIDIFTSQAYRDIIINCFDFCIRNKGMLLYGYVIMSNHIHIIVQSREGKLSDLMRDFKKFTATQILKQLHTEPESRKGWILERFAKATETHTRNKKFSGLAVWQSCRRNLYFTLYVEQTQLHSFKSRAHRNCRKSKPLSIFLCLELFERKRLDRNRNSRQSDN